MAAADKPYPTTVRIEGQFTESEAWLLAQLCKRMTFTHFKELSEPSADEANAYAMRGAVSSLWRVLREHGFDPR